MALLSENNTKGEGLSGRHGAGILGGLSQSPGLNLGTVSGNKC